MGVDGGSTQTLVAAPARARVVITGSWDDLAELREGIASHPELELRGWCEEIHEAAALLAGGPAAVVHAPRPGNGDGGVAAIRELTDAPLFLVTSTAAGDDLPGGVHLLDPTEPGGADRVALLVRPAADERPAALPREGGPGRVLTVFSPKGGTGKSVVAANIAVALAADGVRTLLLDLQLELGDAALMLGFDPDRTVYDLVCAPGELDATKVAGYTSRHESGLEVLPAPLRPEQAENVTEAAVERIVDAARETYDAVVVDTPASFSGALLAALDRTDELLLLCELDVATLKNVRLALETLDLLRFDRDRVSLVLNHAGTGRTMKRSELESALGSRVRFELPHDGAVPEAVAHGRPAALDRGDFSRAVAKLSWELVGRAARNPRREPAAGAQPTKRSRWTALRRG